MPVKALNTESDQGTAARQRWMSVLAKARPAALDRTVRAYGEMPAATILRQPERGAVMVRARAGGNGTPFHLGEMTVTRCSVRLANGIVGHAYVQGRNAVHARQAAVLDAMLQDATHNERVLCTVIEPLEAQYRARAKQRAQRAAETKVEFFTLVRGDN